MKKKLRVVKVGDHLIDPQDVSCVTKIRGKDLYVVRLKSQPNMEYPIWVKEKELPPLLSQLEIVVEDH